MSVSTEYRRTGATVKVIDDNQNSWEDWAGTDINVETTYRYIEGAGPDEWSQEHWSYRGQAAMCRRATDGAIVRVRIGDGTSGDRTIYRQIITDPTAVGQWTSWTQLYTGTHYAVAIQEDPSVAAGYRVYHSKVDGVYVDNVLKYGQTLVIRIKPVAYTPGMIYWQNVQQDVDGERQVQWGYTPDINAASPVAYADSANYRWYRHDLVAVRVPTRNGNLYHRLRSIPMEASARNKGASETLVAETSFQIAAPDDLSFNTWFNVRHLKGPSGQAGYKAISNLYITKLSSYGLPDPYYVFFNERHMDTAGNVMSNLKMPLFWARFVPALFPHNFKGPNLTQPVPVGFSVWGFAGAVQHGDYVYLAGNGRVLRRLNVPVEIDASNYLVEGDYALPRENEPARGRLICANPSNVLGQSLGLADSTQAGLTERPVIIELGAKGPTDTDYRWKRDTNWWISALRKSKSQEKQRIEIEVSDFWHRLEHSFRDTYSVPGRFEWVDWQPEGANQLYNYSNDGDQLIKYNPAGADENSVPRLRTVGTTGSTTLFAGWRGENGALTATLYGAVDLVFRYQDADNHYYVSVGPSSITIGRRAGGTNTVHATLSTTTTFPVKIAAQFRWGRLQVLKDGLLVLSHTLVTPEMFTGFTGFKTAAGNVLEVSNLLLAEYTHRLTTSDVIRQLLAYGDEHMVEIESEEEADQINLLWGPQSDLNSPAKALRQQLETSTLQIAWRPISPPYGEVVMATPDLIAYWPLFSGATAWDLESSLDGVLTGSTAAAQGPLYTDATRSDGARSFDGGDYYTLPDSNYLKPHLGSFSWEVWFKTTSTTRRGIYRYSNASNELGILIDVSDTTAGRVRAAITASTVVYEAGYNGSLNDDLWHHAVWVLNRATGRFLLYVDGVQRADVDASGLAAVDLSGSTSRFIGSNDGGVDMVGSLAHIAAYTGALDEDTIQRHHLAGVSGLTDTGRLKVGKFDEDEIAYTVENEIIAYEQVTEGRNRANVVVVDGEDDSWTEYDRDDLIARDQPVNAYLDLPELKTPGEVRQRAIEELTAARRAHSPGGAVVWQPWFHKMDRIYWIDEDSNKYETRIEGLAVEFSQSLAPFQRATIDTGTLTFCAPEEEANVYIARDLFDRDTATGLGSALVGGTWTIHT